MRNEFSNAILPLTIMAVYLGLVVWTPIEAYRKGRSVIGWLIVAIVSSPVLALIIMAFTSPKPRIK